MQTLVHADIFFFVSTIALVVLSIGAAVGLCYVIGILRDVREVSKRLTRASADLEKDFEALRSSVKAEGNKVKGIADLILGFMLQKVTAKMPKRKKSAPAEPEDSADL